MLKHTVIATAAAALLATGLAHAQGDASAPKREMRVYGEEVMTPQERQAYIDKMRAAKTPEERSKLRAEHRAEVQTRAQDKGVTLKEPQRGAGPPKGGRQSKMGSLFTPEEQADFHRRMKEAKTPEERDKVRADMRAQADVRAKEKGMAKPAPDAPKAQ